METFIGTKVVKAEPMSLWDWKDFNKKASKDIPATYKVKGYKILYADGFCEWIPEDQFRKVYKPGKKLPFADALYLMKQGKTVKRSGWKNKTMTLKNGTFVYQYPMSEAYFTNISASLLLSEDWELVDVKS